MKKLVIISIILILLVGCSDHSQEDYQRALERTERIEQESFKFFLNMDTEIETNTLTPNQQRIGSVLKTLGLTVEGAVDHLRHERTQDIHLSLSGSGLNFDYYEQEDDLKVKVPFVKEYVSLDAWANMTRDLEVLWQSSLKVEKVDKKETGLIEMPDGKVKVTRYEVMLSETSLHDFLQSLVNLGFKRLEAVGMDLDAKEDVLEVLPLLSIDSFEYEVFVAADDYIVKEILRFNISVPEAYNDYIKYSSLRIERNRYKLNEDQMIERPNFDESNTITVEVLKEKLKEILSPYAS